jgi:hypothetical protein
VVTKFEEVRVYGKTRTKLPRLHKDEKYITGDAQTWTYEYTWEDFEIAKDFALAAAAWNPTAISLSIYEYFRWHPEKLLEGGICKEKGYSLDNIIDFFKQGTVPV